MKPPESNGSQEPNEPNEPEEPDDSPIVRLLCSIFAYSVSMGAGALSFAVIMFLLQTGVLFRPIAKYNLHHIEESNRRIVLWTKIAAIAGAAGGVWFLAVYVKRK